MPGRLYLRLVMFAIAIVISAPWASAAGGFTYPGRVTNGDAPITGSCDLTFTLWDTAGSGSPSTGGNPIGYLGSNAMTFRVNGSERIRIASDGSLGVGISSPNTKVSWQVNGIRQDPWANANRIPADEAKPADERGAYMHPEAYGQPESKGIEARHMPDRAAHKPQDASRK
ncbi:MAG: hypothetical protein KA354_17095 [Phycisphaerae bacterium]|nr:hypothetical protein [Phycisphaerae bacterium]